MTLYWYGWHFIILSDIYLILSNIQIWVRGVVVIQFLGGVVAYMGQSDTWASLRRLLGCPTQDYCQISNIRYTWLLGCPTQDYCQISNISYTKYQNWNVSHPVTVVSAQSIEAMCQVENEDVVGAAPTGDAPTTSEWSIILLPAEVVSY